MRQWIATMCLLVLGSFGQAQAATVLVVGDSISAAFGLETQEGWVTLLEERLREHNPEFKVVNASISGETTGGGLARFPQLLSEHQPDYVIIELGGNDGLRGLSLTQMSSNLTRMVQQAKQQDAVVLLLGMRLPGNYGQRYTEAFYNVYQQIAEQENVAVVDFFLAGVGGEEGMMQADGVHPTQMAQPLLLDNAWQRLAPLLPLAPAQ
ncbi:arylesterase [Denitrificimonas caeni]|jgi:acyl-CoA thioesterase-1|uniref:arylesterase n=1 Tax=Denitrificimonas caeni TaxID=521720 RepID=UPI0003B726A1|nr:arylesterase [Denitrificimonas caeni]